MSILIGVTSLFLTLLDGSIAKTMSYIGKDSLALIHMSNDKSCSVTVSAMCTSFSLSSQSEYTQLDQDTGLVFLCSSLFYSEEFMLINPHKDEFTEYC